MKKKIVGQIKLQVAAGKANPAPPIGPALGARGVAIPVFCKQFNDLTAHFKPGVPIPVVITVYADKSFTFITKTPPTSYLVKEKAGVERGAKLPKRDPLVYITKKDVEEIAKVKISEVGINSLESMMRSVEGTAKSMGIEIKD